MTAESRQQRRKLARERTEAGRRCLAKGVAVRPSGADMAAVAHVLLAKLSETGNPARAGEAAALAQSLSERSLRSHPSAVAIACTKGCSYCCYGFVGALPPEAFRIAAAVLAGTASGLDVASVRARAARTHGLSPDQRFGAKVACPLLVDGICGVYADRPLVCRQATSLALPDCVEEFEGIVGTGRVEISSTHLAHASNAHLALLGAVMAAGLPSESYELGALLEAILSDPGCEARWLAGEPVFAHLAGRVQRPAPVNEVARRLADEIRA